MELSDKKIMEYSRRMMLSRMRILNSHGFYGILLMNMRFAIDTECRAAATDGITIFFGPSFLELLSDPELDFVMMHEILHAALQHIVRGKELDEHIFNIACDIVVNSNILFSNNMEISSISIDGEESMHLTPDGEEGYLYSAEEVYAMLRSECSRKKCPEKSAAAYAGTIDEHSKWRKNEQGSSLQDLWIKRINDAAAAMEIREQSRGIGHIPLCIQRVLSELRKPQTDWRTVLNDFMGPISKLCKCN
ncbi:MAG: hypothetical protein ACI4K7_10835, partial [Oscillospiraceae bacterium]